MINTSERGAIEKAINGYLFRKKRRSHKRAEDYLPDFIEQLCLPKQFPLEATTSFGQERNSDEQKKLEGDRGRRQNENREKALSFIIEVILPTAYYNGKIRKAYFER